MPHYRRHLLPADPENVAIEGVRRPREVDAEHRNSGVPGINRGYGLIYLEITVPNIKEGRLTAVAVRGPANRRHVERRLLDGRRRSSLRLLPGRWLSRLRLLPLH